MVIDLVLARAILIQYQVLRYFSSRKLETDYLQKRTRPSDQSCLNVENPFKPMTELSMLLESQVLIITTKTAE